MFSHMLFPDLHRLTIKNSFRMKAFLINVSSQTRWSVIFLLFLNLVWRFVIKFVVTKCHAIPRKQKAEQLEKKNKQSINTNTFIFTSREHGVRSRFLVTPLDEFKVW